MALVGGTSNGLLLLLVTKVFTGVSGGGFLNGALVSYNAGYSIVADFRVLVFGTIHGGSTRDSVSFFGECGRC